MTDTWSRVRTRPRSAAEELGDLEREVERLAGVEPRVATGLVALLQVGAQHLVAAPQAFGHVLAGELDVHTARPHLCGVTCREESVQLAHDVLEVAGLVAARVLEGVAVHRV